MFHQIPNTTHLLLFAWRGREVTELLGDGYRDFAPKVSFYSLPEPCSGSSQLRSAAFSFPKSVMSWMHLGSWM